MKISILLLLFTVSAFTQDKFVCQEFDRKTEKILTKTIVLEKTGKKLQGDFKIPELQFEASKTPYEMTIYKNGLKSWDAEVYKGYVYEEDVIFVFKAKGKQVSFKLYLDEMEEGYLQINRMRTQYFFCH